MVSIQITTLRRGAIFFRPCLEHHYGGQNIIIMGLGPQWRSGKGRPTYFDKFVSQHPSGAGSSPAGSISRDLNSQRLDY